MFVRMLLMAIGLASVAGVLSHNRAGHEVVRVTPPEALRPVEVSVAINPTNLDHVVAVALQAGRPGQPRTSNYSFTSIDGGKTWKMAAAPNPQQRVQGDCVVAFAPDGVAHQCYIAFDGIRTPLPLRACTGIFCTSSRDGIMWSEPVPVVDHINCVTPFEDKPWLAIDGSPESPHRGNIYVAWTRFDVYGSKDPNHHSHIYLARSRDGGKSFQPPTRISHEAGDCQDHDNTLEGAVPAVGPKGEVYIAWGGPKGIVFTASTDGGFSFSKEKVIAEQPGGWSLPDPGLPRHNGMPVTAVDNSNGPNRGSVYVNWIDERNKDLDVFIASSRDGGTTWSSPVRVNDDPKGNGKAQLFTWMAVDPADGSANVVFYDRRDCEDKYQGLTLARSVDGGKTFVNHRIQQEPFTLSRPVFMGDYIGIDARTGRVVAVYPHVVNDAVVLSAALFRFKPGTQEYSDEPAQRNW
jgi:hypothetical protein